MIHQYTESGQNGQEESSYSKWSGQDSFSLSRESGEAEGTKNKARGIILPNIKAYYMAIVIEIVIKYCQRDKHIQKWNKKRFQKYAQLIFNKGTKAIQWRKISLFNKWHWNN